MKTITVFCGESIEDKCDKQLHPINEVFKAQKLILSDNDEIVYSNSPEFISAIKYIGFEAKIKTTFYLNGICLEDDIEPIFKDLNRSLDLIQSVVTSYPEVY